MAKQPETAREWLEHFDGLQRKNAQIYQETGMQRYDDAEYLDNFCPNCGADMRGGAK